MRIEYTTLCKQGKKRNNEDYLLVDSHPEQNHWMGIICDGFYFYAEKGIEQGIIGVYGNNNQTLGIWHDNPEYVGNLDECTTIDTAISKKCKSLLQKGMKTLDGTYGQIAVIDAQIS